MNITFIGTGYVGIVNAACFAQAGHTVTCYDHDAGKIEDLKQGRELLYEPGLQELLERNQAERRLFFTGELSEALQGCALCFITVSTPQGPDGAACIDQVMKAAAAVAERVDQDLLLVCKSTVPVGTCQKISQAVHHCITERGVPHQIEVLFNPEFLRQGSAVTDCTYPDRVIVGSPTPASENLLRELYIPHFCSQDQYLSMDLSSAELTKYAANAMLAARVSLINEIANLCEHVGADIELVREGLARDPRIGAHFLAPGSGYGGSCFPKDVKALIATGREHQVEMRILQAVDDVNQAQRRILAKKVLQVFGNDLQGKTMAVWGLTFKPDTDDLREAPALYTIKELLEHGALVKAYDPQAHSGVFMKEMGHDSRVVRVADKYEALQGAHALLLITEWQEFAEPDWDRVLRELNGSLIFDGRNLYDADALARKGLTCYAIGKGHASISLQEDTI